MSRSTLTHDGLAGPPVNAGTPKRRPRRHSLLDELTRREREILGLMAEGRSNRGMAEALSLELKTVEGHVGQIFGKLGLEPQAEDHRRVLAVLTFLRSE